MILLVKALQALLRPFFWGPAGLGFWAISVTAWKICLIAALFGIRRMVRDNLRLVFPASKDIDHLAKNLISNIAQSLVEILCAPFFSREQWQRRFVWDGLEHLDAAVKSGKGVMLLNIHAGNYELMGMALFRRGYPLVGVVRSTDDPLFKLLDEIRLSAGGELVNVKDDDMYREALKILAERKIIFTMVDTGALESRNTKLKILGQEVAVATGWLTLAQRAGCAVLPATTHRQDGKLVATFGQPFFVTKDNRDAVIIQTADFYDRFLTAHPEEWAIFLNSYETKRMVTGK
jgi:KDO2-lipid IV(A) lauroyltransferase